MSAITSEKPFTTTEINAPYHDVREMPETSLLFLSSIQERQSVTVFRVDTSTVLSNGGMGTSKSTQIPNSIYVIKFSFLAVGIIFLSQIIFALFDYAFVNGFVAIEGAVSFFGLYLVAARAIKELSEKGVIS